MISSKKKQTTQRKIDTTGGTNRKTPEQRQKKNIKQHYFPTFRPEFINGRHGKLFYTTDANPCCRKGKGVRISIKTAEYKINVTIGITHKFVSRK